MSARVLIVDDDPDDIAIIEKFLLEDADSIRSITDSKLFEDAFNDFEPDLVLLDLHMPDPDGLAILRRFRVLREKLGFVPFVVLTGDTGKVARNSALVLGADDFLTKPLDKHEVVLRVRNLLRTRGLYLDLARSNEDLERELRSKN
ncbi:MAG TPA: response regulator [Methylomirabilota bacterium]|nr:response regulator [Methylomirabilota bacterium]